MSDDPDRRRVLQGFTALVASLSFPAVAQASPCLPPATELIAFEPGRVWEWYKAIFAARHKRGDNPFFWPDGHAEYGAVWRQGMRAAVRIGFIDRANGTVRASDEATAIYQGVWKARTAHHLREYQRTSPERDPTTDKALTPYTRISFKRFLAERQGRAA